MIMNDKLGRMAEGNDCCLGNYLCICLNILNKTLINVSHDNWYFGWDLNGVSPEYVAGVLTPTLVLGYIICVI
jgi:hypothetical protein